jgi:hypothetical protein
MTGAGGSYGPFFAGRARRRIPIVFVQGADRTGSGYGWSLTRPDGNVTRLVSSIRELLTNGRDSISAHVQLVRKLDDRGGNPLAVGAVAELVSDTVNSIVRTDPARMRHPSAD